MGASRLTSLGRFDAKYLLILRRLVMDLEPEPLRQAIFFLSHAGDHPNILWNTDKKKGNWIDLTSWIRSLLHSAGPRRRIARMIRAVHYSDWGYHTLGRVLDVLFYKDKNIVAKLHISIKLLLPDPEEEYAIRAASVALSHSKDQRKELALLAQEFPSLAEHEWFEGVSAEVEVSGRTRYTCSVNPFWPQNWASLIFGRIARFGNVVEKALRCESV